MGLELQVNHLMCVLGTDWGPLEEQQVVLTAEPSLQLLKCIYTLLGFCVCVRELGFFCVNLAILELTL